MPLYNTKPVFLFFVPLLMLHHNLNLSFEFKNFFGPYTNIITYQGDAVASNGAIQLTKIYNTTVPYSSAGRASYALPICLYNPTIGLASFTTTFSFPVTTNGQNIGDGITFFIVAPSHLKIPESSGGGYLGLFSPETAFNNSQNHIVAVEFDMFANEWDPPYTHVGINVNSISSLATVKWDIDPIQKISTVFATVNYDALSQRLSVVVVNKWNEYTVSLSEEINLREILPDLVIVGFSGATGGLQSGETHKILSWTFSSSMYKI